MTRLTDPAVRAHRTQCLRASVPQCLALLLFGSLACAAEADGKWPPPYQNDPAVVKQLEALGDNTAAVLPVKVTGLEGGWEKNGWLANGPFTRGYCTKMPYASDRKTAFYCGQDHNLPHFNDAWEFHLGSATWHCLSNPDGGDTGNPWRNWQGELKGEKDPAKHKAIEDKIRGWMEANVKFENGYLQTKKNDGPVFGWHTWDGLSYDPLVGKMFWVVLDDQETQFGYLRTYCQFTGKDFEAEKKKLKPGTGMWSFDPGTKKWARWTGDGPHARMRGMGGTFHYLPDLKKMIWYCSAQNVVPHEYTMWSYDAVADKWEELKPNGGKDIATLLYKDKVAPPDSLQVAYSPKHHKLVAVQKKETFVYDAAANAWSKAATEEGQYAADCRTVFAYDSASDVFLLFNAPKGEWNDERNLRAFDLKTGKWETLAPQGAPLPQGIRKGYYDPEHNALVLADQGPVWVYRHKRAGTK
jgi:hypothetical protein